MAETQSIALEIVTPEGVAVRESVQELTLPGVAGEFGVLPGHRPLMAAVRTGIVTYVKGNQPSRCATGAGFAEVAGDRVVLLVERHIVKDRIDPVRVRLELKESTEALDAFAGETASSEHGELVSRQLWAAAQLELYGDPPPPTFRVFAEVEAEPRERFSGPAPDEPHGE
jgi:F-type H+-transporting ATPase subunit epsilon